MNPKNRQANHPNSKNKPSEQMKQTKQKHTEKIKNKLPENLRNQEHQIQEQRTEEETEFMQIEGKNPIIEALRAGQQMDKILIAEGLHQIDEIKQLASERGVKYQFVTRQKIEQIATTKVNQGLIAFVAHAQYIEMDQWLDSLDMSKNPVVVMLAELQDPHNVGSIIRSAEASGVAGVVIAKHRSVGITATVAKSSAGAVAHMPIIRVTNLAQSLEEMKARGFWVVGTDAKADKHYYDIQYNMPTVLIIGSEGKGMGPLLEKKCDYLTKIPMLGNVTSLNASVAAGIMLFEIVKQRLR
ncbi:23S rRNA (guanosine(2251)-2'-O)-methyltransferase RlmB [Desulfuribacillus stibiiarsenatis]|uniref:23S rRNA (Guanosine(2251)-2'-O)-methyltransferase RlmB n=2 Tax=Desulfuribacillus stibiiarsenatis TaxID=1390249 RepID=A0A1E5L8M0_9FIRM|nr:23S rRNA (guanosine(2251)-2'-O)-methyltransferase RlmB [Desulfuribacillus stibiiarsenatis]